MKVKSSLGQAEKSTEGTERPRFTNGPRSERWAALFLFVIVVVPSLVTQLLSEELKEDDPQTVDLWARTAENGGWDPGTLTIPANTSVRLRLISLDVIHGFRIDNPNGSLRYPLFISGPIDSDLSPVFVELPPLAAGNYTFSCSIACSQLHTDMRGRLLVVPG